MEDSTEAFIAVPIRIIRNEEQGFTFGDLDRIKKAVSDAYQGCEVHSIGTRYSNEKIILNLEVMTPTPILNL